MDFAVGDTVRAVLHDSTGAEQRSSRACVAFINVDDGGSLDLIYQAPEWAGGKEEEAQVAPSRVSQLLPFETEPEEEQEGDDTVQRWKQQGDQLFGLHDHQAACERYALALSKLVPPLRVGTCVLVRCKAASPSEGSSVTHQGFRHRQATVADMDADGRRVDVIYDEEETREGEEEEEDGVGLERVGALAGGRGRVEQARVLLNMARCHLNGTAARVDEALGAATRALALLLRGEGEGQGEWEEGTKEAARKLLVSAYRVCSVAYMRAQDYRRAKHCAALLSRLPGQADVGQRLVQEVERDMARKQVENKRLVKDMSRWIDSAVKSQEGGAHTKAHTTGAHTGAHSGAHTGAHREGGAALQQGAEAEQGQGVSTSDPQACTIS